MFLLSELNQAYREMKNQFQSSERVLQKELKTFRVSLLQELQSRNLLQNNQQQQQSQYQSQSSLVISNKSKALQASFQNTFKSQEQGGTFEISFQEEEEQFEQKDLQEEQLLQKDQQIQSLNKTLHLQEEIADEYQRKIISLKDQLDEMAQQDCQQSKEIHSLENEFQTSSSRLGFLSDLHQSEKKALRAQNFKQTQELFNLKELNQELQQKQKTNSSEKKLKKKKKKDYSSNQTTFEQQVEEEDNNKENSKERSVFNDITASKIKNE